MPTLQKLDGAQICEALSDATQRRTPATLTLRTGTRWVSLRSRFLREGEDLLWMELPTGGEEETPHEFAPQAEIGLSFKLRHHKYLCAITVVRMDRIALGGGVSVAAFGAPCPERMHRLQRRAFQRVAVPPGRIVRASFWPGGREAEPTRVCPERPVWSGSVTDISAGGFRVRTGSEALSALEPGFVVGVRLAFGATANNTLYADAQFRHGEIDGEAAVIGFQLTGLAQTDEGRETLRAISAHVAGFQRSTLRAHVRQR